MAGLIFQADIPRFKEICFHEEEYLEIFYFDVIVLSISHW